MALFALIQSKQLWLPYIACELPQLWLPYIACELPRALKYPNPLTIPLVICSTIKSLLKFPAAAPPSLLHCFRNFGSLAEHQLQLLFLYLLPTSSQIYTTSFLRNNRNMRYSPFFFLCLFLLAPLFGFSLASIYGYGSVFLISRPFAIYLSSFIGISIV